MAWILILIDQTLIPSGLNLTEKSTFKAQAVNLQAEIFKCDSLPDFARGVTVDFALLDPEMLTQEEAIML